MTRAFLAVTTILFLGLATACGDDGSAGDSSMDGSGGDGGGGGVGDSCTYTADCGEGLFCATVKTCQPAGSGGSGDVCTFDGDCQRGLVCEMEGGELRCVAPGPGDVGDSCASRSDCIAGLFCIDSRCNAIVPDAGTPDGSTEDSGGGMDTGVPPPPPTCLAYCGLVIGNCEGAAQYGSFAECMGHCENTGGWVAGNNGDTSGNTIGCRITYAERAEEDTANCAAAGPSGGNVCGSWCDVYCTQVATNCTGANEITFDPDCATECAGLAADAPAISTMGNSVQCRIYHSGVPAGADPSTHCPHAAPDSSGFCVDPP
jgi:hypothetical protein